MIYVFLSTKIIQYLRIGSCLACVYRVMDARGKFGEHERSVIKMLARRIYSGNLFWYSNVDILGEIRLNFLIILVIHRLSWTNYIMCLLMYQEVHVSGVFKRIKLISRHMR